jgi:hypothetical protein
VEDPEASTLPIYATGCVAVVDGVPISPREVNIRGRMIHVTLTQAEDPATRYAELEVESFREDLLVEVVEGEVLSQELDRLGFTIDEATHRAVVTKWMGDYESYEFIMRGYVGPGLTYEEVLATTRGWSRARAYVCSVRDCVATEADMREVFEEKSAEAEAEGEAFGSFEENAFALRFIAEDRKWLGAYEAVVRPLVEEANIERFPENVVINEGYAAGLR